MPNRSLGLISLLITGFFVTNAFAAGPFGNIHVGNWNGGAYTDDKTGAFSHCSAATAYASGISLIVGQNANDSWLLAFASPAFNLTPGEMFPIDVTFDGQAQYHLFGPAVVRNLVTSILPSTAIVEQFRKAKLMVAVAKGNTFQFNLNSTGQLLPVIANCVVKTKSEGTGKAGDFAISVPKPVVSKPVVQATSPAKASKTVDMNGSGFVVSAGGTY
jgi:hypothetical protein